MTATSTGIRQVLAGLGLGDLITLPDGTYLTVRSVEKQLQVPVGSMNGFILGGEIGPQATLLSLPSAVHAPVNLYTPVECMPVGLGAVSLMCEGVLSYWAPHLPNLSGALGELAYRVFRVRGQVEPLVILWRGDERVVFVLSGVASQDDLECLHMDVNASATELRVLRHSATVTDPAQVPAPAPARTPALAPLRRPLVRR